MVGYQRFQNTMLPLRSPWTLYGVTT